MRTTPTRVDVVAGDPFTPPLFLRFPALAWLPRVRLGSFPTPVEPATLPGGAVLWIKRDDLSASPLGGNKVRGLEFLLAGVGRGDTVITVGARGSTHALATATYARALGARAVIWRWPQENNAESARVTRAVERAASEIHDAVHPLQAMAGAWLASLRPNARRVPAGGTAPLGILGHVNAALELSEQIAAGRLPAPETVVVPLGSGGTAAGLALGFAIAGVRARVLAAAVAPRIVANRARVLRLASRAARLIEGSTGHPVPRPSPDALTVTHEEYGGAYGRATESGRAAARWLRTTARIDVDATYSAKALAAAMTVSRRGAPTLFWLTFDARSVILPSP